MNTKDRKRLIHKQRGANLVEYALLASLILLAGYPAFINIGSKTGANLCRVSVGVDRNVHGSFNSTFNPDNIYLDLTPGSIGCTRVTPYNPCFNGRNPYYDLRTGTVSCLRG